MNRMHPITIASVDALHRAAGDLLDRLKIGGIPRYAEQEAEALSKAAKFSIEARPVPLGNQRTPGTRNVILFDGLPLTEQEEYAAAKAIADLRVDEEVPDWEEYLCQLLLEWETGRISPSIGMSLAVRHETEKAFRRVNSFWKEWDKRRVDALVGRTHTEDRQDGEDVG